MYYQGNLMQFDKSVWYRDNIKLKFLDISLSNDFFLKLTLKAKTNINKWDYIKLKSFCITKETINKMKRQPTEWEKVFINHISDKRLISKIHNSKLEVLG